MHTATPLEDGDKSPSEPIPNGTAHAKSNGNDVRGLHAFFMRAFLILESGHR